jgi:hypothetical protein
MPFIVILQDFKVVKDLQIILKEIGFVQNIEKRTEKW